MVFAILNPADNVENHNEYEGNQIEYYIDRLVGFIEEILYLVEDVNQNFVSLDAILCFGVNALLGRQSCDLGVNMGVLLVPLEERDEAENAHSNGY